MTAKKSKKNSKKFIDILEKRRIISSCMDTNDFSIIPECGGLPDLTRFPVIVGVKQLKKALNKGVAHHVFLAENADPGLTEPIAVLCEDRGIPLTWVSSMSSLGQACGIEVGAAAAAILAKS